ncbi:MAG: RNA methyltransferase [Myxococcales bacterium]|jgi:tRNA (guanosine-2'-O-)-methyltransferase
MRRDRPDAAPLPDAPALPATPERVLQVLEPLLLPERLARIDAVLEGRMRSVVPVLEGVEDPHNVAAVLRSAEAFGTQEVHLVARDKDFLASQKITQGGDRWLDLVRHASPRACVDSLRARGYRVYVATMDGDTSPEQLARVPKVAIVFGNERDGVTGSTRALADGRYTIPMRGFAQSLNVSVAAALTLYTATRERTGDLDCADRLALRARWAMLSVDRAEEIVCAALGGPAEAPS